MSIIFGGIGALAALIGIARFGRDIVAAITGGKAKPPTAEPQPDPVGYIEYERGVEAIRNRPGQRHDSSNARRSPISGPARAQAPALDLDLRGETLDDAFPHVEEYLRRAHDAGLPWVRVNHGDAASNLCRGIRILLAQNNLVQRYESGHPDEGGEEVTVVHLAE